MLVAGDALVDCDVLGAADVVAADSTASSEPGRASPLFATGVLSADGDGVDAAVSSMAGRASMRSMRAEAEAETESLVRESSGVAPVLARLCLGWSASEGERDRLRVVSASGMVVNSVSQGSREGGPVSKGDDLGEVSE